MYMKRLLYIFFTIGLMLGCTRQEPEMPVEQPEEGNPAGKVLVQFNVSVPELLPQTKALGDTPAGDLSSMHLAVFGRSGYLKEYVEATITPATANGRIGESTNRYTISAALSLSENSERHIHFIGNGPAYLDYGQETDLIPNMLSPEGMGGYWQYFVLPGIKAQRDVNDTDGDGDTEEYLTTTVNDITYFQAADETAAYFQDVALIRNFAKIVVEDMEDSHFGTVSFAAVNVATQGSMAPYYSGGFVTDYQNKSYTDLNKTLNYPALLPYDADLSGDIPDASHFTSPAGQADVAAAGGSFFLYERPVPNDLQKPTTVIIYGYFTDPDMEDGDDSGYYYYKVDLMDDSGYYPIYRNFKYRIQIQEILRPGSDSPEDAMRSMGSGDISADVSTQNMTDISDGTSHILVSYMSRTLIHQYPYTQGNVTEQLTLMYKYIPDVNADANSDGEADWNNNFVSDDNPTEAAPVSFILQDGLADPIITSYSVGDSEDANGFRTITITTSAPSGNLRTQYLQISGTHFDANGKKTTLFRRVTFSMINTQPLSVACVPRKVQKIQGEDLEVDIIIPKDLPPSMFPLMFYLESDKLSITPDNTRAKNNLPVNPGLSISGSGEQAFHFVRTLSRTEYLEQAEESTTTTVTIPCYFKTNMTESASTVYVTDAEGYFVPGNDYFRNYGTKDFTQLRFPEGVPRTAGSNAPFTFEMDESDDLPEKVYLKFTNVRPLGSSGLSMITNTSDPHYGWYWYSPAQTSVADLRNKYVPVIRLATTDTSGKADVWVDAEEYNPEHLLYEIPATSISLTPTTVTLSVNGGRYNSTAQLTATVEPVNTTDVLTWSSNNTGVARVDANGLVTAVGRGNATITVSDEHGHSATCSVTVFERYWRTDGSYTVSFGSGDYNNFSFTDSGTSGINVLFSNCEWQRDWALLTYTGYRINIGKNNSNGSFTISVPSPDTLEGCKLTGATFTYYTDLLRRTYNNKNVTANRGTVNNKQTWTASSSGEGNGDSSVTITMECTGTNQNGVNAVTDFTINYGYYDYR